MRPIRPSARAEPPGAAGTADRLPAHLPRIEMVVDIDDHACPCCSNALHRIGEDTERAPRHRAGPVPGAGRAPAQIRLPGLRGRGGAGAGAGAADRGRAADRGDGRPGARLQIRRPPAALSAGPDLRPPGRQPRSLDPGRLGRPRRLPAAAGARAAAPSAQGSTKLFADETTAPVLDPGRGRTKTGQLWAYARDDRPWGGTDPPGVAYVYAPDRKAERPIAPPRRLHGHPAGRRLCRLSGPRRARRCRARLLLVPCPPALLRTRRGRSRADRQRGARTHRRALRRSRSEIRGRTADERRAVRQEKSRPIIEALEPWLRAKLALISQKTKLAEAIRYALSRWDGLTRFLDDGRIEIDSNVVERAIRPIALNRKNALFAGSDGGGEHWAVIASLIETCKLNRRRTRRPTSPTSSPRIVNGHPNSQHRRTPALGLSRYPRTLAQGRGLRTSLT